MSGSAGLSSRLAEPVLAGTVTGIRVKARPAGENCRFAGCSAVARTRSLSPLHHPLTKLRALRRRSERVHDQEAAGCTRLLGSRREVERSPMDRKLWLSIIAAMIGASLLVAAATAAPAKNQASKT